MSNKTRKFCLVAILVVVYFGTAFLIRYIFAKSYEEGIKWFETGQYELASERFTRLKDYRDSEDYRDKAEKGLELPAAIALYNEGNYGAAAEKFLEINQKIDCTAWIEKTAAKIADQGQYEKAISVVERSGDSQAAQEYKDLLRDVQNNTYIVAQQLYNEEKYEDALAIFVMLNDYKDAKQYVEKCQDMIQRLNLSKTVAAGARTVVGIKNDHTLAVSGDTSVFDFSNFSGLISVDIGEMIAVGLKSDGTVVLTGGTPAYIKANDWEDVMAVSAGGNYIVALKKDGTVVSQGHNGDKQCDVSAWHDIVAIATGWRHTVGLDKNGDIFVAGFASEKLLKEITDNKTEWNNIVAIDAGGGGTNLRGHIVGLRQDGTVVAVGDNTYGQCEVSEWTDIVKIAAGDWHTVGLKSDGTVVSTIPDPNKEFKGRDGETPLSTGCCKVSDLTDVVSISAGTGLTAALNNDGTVIVRGFNDYGQRDGAKSWQDILMYNTSK